jgi:survival-of-motor-neuron-related-splicing factor 30
MLSASNIISNPHPPLNYASLTSRYPARINAVIGSRDSPLYTITFKGYTSSTNVPASSLRPYDAAAAAAASSSSSSAKRGSDSVSDKDKEKKRKKGEKWVAAQTARTNDMRDKKQAWEKFGKKAQKKGIHISG